MRNKADKNKARSYSAATIAAVKRALTESVSPTRAAQAVARFTRHRDGIRKPVAPAPLPDAWKKPYVTLLSELDDIIKKPILPDALFTEDVHEGLRLTALIDSLYGPANNTRLWADHRYTIEWTYRDSADIAGSQVASKTTGHLHVVNVLSPMPPSVHSIGFSSGGTAHAGVGFLFRPKFALTKVTLTPHVPYNYHYIVDHPTNTTLSIAKTSGRLRLVAYRVNLFNKTSLVQAEWEKKLWEAENQPIASRYEGQHKGVFSGPPLQLEFSAFGDYIYAVLCIATVSVTRGYYGGVSGVPPEPTLCTGNLECDVSALWLEQDKRF
jgi:hypothetical protein